MKISVTEGNITNGIPRSSDRCPIAIAMLQLGFYAHVGRIYIQGSHYGMPFRVFTPTVVKDFVDAFDLRGKVEPFEFELEIP